MKRRSALTPISGRRGHPRLFGQPVKLAATLLTVSKAKAVRVTATAKKFAERIKPKVTVRVSKSNNGAVAVGKVRVDVGSKAVKTKN
jgi:hypothetical protein